MIAEIITIGTEILIGSIVNINGPYLSEKLTNMGHEVRYHTSVRDDGERIREALSIASERADIIFLCGGLGPTADDMTKEVTSSYLKRPLVEDEKSWEYIQSRLLRYSSHITPTNRKQALYMEGSTILPNPYGTAIGDCIQKDGKYYILLPGPPKEFKPMVDYVTETLLPQGEKQILIHCINTMFLGESSAEMRIRELDLETEFMEINTFAKPNELQIQIMATVDVNDKNQVNIYQQAIENLRKEFKDHIVFLDGQTIEETLVHVLMDRKETISFVESITGGFIASKFVEIANVSKVFRGSYITYSDEAKNKMVDVDASLIDKYTAVSEEVARAMSLGGYQKTKADYIIAVTGEAGPISSSGKPVGTVFYSINYHGEEILHGELFFMGGRDEIIMRTEKYVLGKLIQGIRGGSNGK